MIDFSTLLAEAKLVQTLFTVAAGFAESLDNAMPPGTPGKTKMDVLVGAMKAEVATVGVAEGQFNAVWPRAAALVEAALAAKKAIQAAAAPAAPAPAAQ
jgi:hypothetical protein